MPYEFITTEARGHVWTMGLNRPAKRNAFTMQMLAELGHAYAELEANPDLRCGLLFAHGGHFTGGIDLKEFGPAFAKLPDPMAPAPDGVDPLDVRSRRSKPVVMAAQGICFTIGVELMLASDIVVAASDCRFALLEVQRGLYPLCGGTFRFVRHAGWGPAMRWLLTGDEFGAAEALRMGLVQEVCEPAATLATAERIAHRIAEAAPLGVAAARASAWTFVDGGEAEAIQRLHEWMPRIAHSDDYEEGIRSFVERRPAKFTGR